MSDDATPTTQDPSFLRPRAHTSTLTTILTYGKPELYMSEDCKRLSLTWGDSWATYALQDRAEMVEAVGLLRKQLEVIERELAE